ncbi:AraC family transcriptional regulator [Piscinibacter sp.]|uniref:AraC family transcriptional regulator n=1 Tax=Piscinibacter sp. TaxID=1903157 RepID=UPI002F3ED435
MAESLALHEGAYGRVALLRLHSGLVAHAHSDSHIVWWLGGAAAQTRIGTQVVRYSSALASAVNAYEQHDLTLTPDEGASVFLAFYISKDWLDRRSEVAGRPFVFSSLRIPIDSEMRAAAWQLLDMMTLRTEAAAVVETAVETLLETTILAAQRDSRARGLRPTFPLLDHRLRRSITLMRRHVEARLTLDELAHQASLSRARLFDLFRDQLNTTPQVFWSAIRLEEAIKRLVRGNIALADVAHDLGFSAASNFSRFFKEHTGVSPSEYRRAATGTQRGLSDSLVSINP